MTSDHFRKHTTRIIAARPCCDSCSFLRRVGRLWKHLSSNARLISPPRAAESRWGLSGQLVHLVWWSSRQRGRNRRGTERILILTKLTHLGLRSGSRSLVPLCETVKNEQLFAHREGPYLTLFSPSCHLPWNENLSIKTEKKYFGDWCSSPSSSLVSGRLHQSSTLMPLPFFLEKPNTDYILLRTLVGRHSGNVNH